MREIQERVELYGEHGLEKLRQSVAKAVEENKVKLTPEELASMPPVPDITKAPRLAVKTSLKQLGGSGDGGGFIVTAAPSARKTRSSANTTSLSSSSSSIPPPVDTLQFVETETAFGHVRFCFNTLHLPDRLRPYLVLFQELMFQSPLIQDSGELMDYRLVVQNTSDLLISHEAAMVKKQQKITRFEDWWRSGGGR